MRMCLNIFISKTGNWIKKKNLQIVRKDDNGQKNGANSCCINNKK